MQWKKGETWFQMIAAGGLIPEQTPDLITLARQLAPDESLVQLGRQPTPPPPQDFAEAYTNLPDLEAFTGFDILEPAVLPEGLSFSHARYIPGPGIVMLFYGSFGPDLIHSSGPVLRIHQWIKSGRSFEMPKDYPPEAIKSVNIDGYPGILMIGALHTQMAVSGQPTPAPTWLEDGSLSLRWQTDTIEYFIGFSPSNFGSRLSKEDLLNIADSLH